MDRNTLEAPRDNYPTSSWALWSPSFPEEGCVEEDPKALYEYNTVGARASNITPTEADADNIFAQLRLLGQEEYHILYLLEEVFGTLNQTLGVSTPEVSHRVPGGQAQTDSTDSS